MNFLTNAFSINMLDGSAAVHFERVGEDEFRRQLIAAQFVSAIGHSSLSVVLSDRLGISVPANRLEISLDADVVLYVAQVKGRLPEGRVLSHEEMQHVQIDFWRVSRQVA